MGFNSGFKGLTFKNSTLCPHGAQPKRIVFTEQYEPNHYL